MRGALEDRCLLRRHEPRREINRPSSRTEAAGVRRLECAQAHFLPPPRHLWCHPSLGQEGNSFVKGS
jgi:hypothetical protein